jgi:hypothetical protein
MLRLGEAAGCTFLAWSCMSKGYLMVKKSLKVVLFHQSNIKPMKATGNFGTRIETKTEFPDEIVTRWSVSTYEKTNGFVAIKEFRHSGDPKTFCFETSLLTVNGTVTTDKNGQSEIRISDFMCGLAQGPGSRVMYHGPVNFIVTPRTDQLVLYNAVAAINESGNDILLKVYSKNNNEDPLSDISFYWQLKCRYSIEMG